LLAGVALAAMAVATFVTDSQTAEPGASVNADAGYTVVSQTPGNAPSVASAKPKVAPTAFAGQDWPGLGSFGEHWSNGGSNYVAGEHP
jgi:hypothetical protein